MFRFKQFNIDQTGCAMKINTDGVLLGAMATGLRPGRILDIGTGTGVIALMLAQRYSEAQIDAVEIDADAAKTASINFQNSPFSKKLKVFNSDIGNFFERQEGDKYDLVVSNPPFYINALESPKANKSLAKHANTDFFERLIKDIAGYLSPDGLCWMILPVQTTVVIKALVTKNGLYVQKTIGIHSFEDSDPHREIVCLGLNDTAHEAAKFVIYKLKDVYTDAYKALLQPYFINF
ncbi:MAG: tRNA1(Val) (adenine(37)-N6)-methyltransferase [Mucilaginibacter sp.]